MLKPLNWRKPLLYTVFAIILVIAVYLASRLPSADWFDTFDPAARGVFSGLSPYHRPAYANPVWGVVPLLPLVLFPPEIAHGLMYVACVLILLYILWHLKAGIVASTAFFLSPTAIGALLVNNLDPIVISGILFPPAWGLFLLVLKPQIGFGVIVYYLVEIWRKHGFWRVARAFAPVSLAWLISAVLFPVWIERMMSAPQLIWNRSLFPYLIPLGLFLLWLAFRYENPYFALASSLFFAPYHSLYSYIAVQIGLMHPDVEKFIRRDLLQVLLTIFLWAVTLIFRL